MTPIDVLAYVLAVLGTGISAYQDLRTTYIPDEITHFMAIVGVILLFIRFPVSQALLYLGLAGLVFGVLFLFYTFGQLGGGDVKLYTALALLVPRLDPILKVARQPPYPAVISIFFTSALLGTFFISLKYALRLVRDRAMIEGFTQKMVFSLFALLVTNLLPISIGTWAMLVVTVPVSLGIAILPFKDDIIEHYVLAEKRISKLTEDDIIAVDFLDEKTKEALGLGMRKTLLNFELKGLKTRAKKHGIRKIPVYENLPTFGLYIFLGLLLTLVVGDTLFLILTLST